MKYNVGGADRAVRMTLGVGLFFVGYFGGLSTFGTIGIFILAAIGFITGLINFCPLYQLFGINTCGEPMKKRLSHR
ncbi:MAG TPA: DUF2892 domain-containing protein [Candidatus Manganitrophaceae bacterium]|nr:DUF2892 domain-containing protein [Candidatus Manganitrophaceae bacterium]